MQNLEVSNLKKRGLVRFGGGGGRTWESKRIHVRKEINISAWRCWSPIAQGATVNKIYWQSFTQAANLNIFVTPETGIKNRATRPECSKSRDSLSPACISKNKARADNINTGIAPTGLFKMIALVVFDWASACSLPK